MQKKYQIFVSSTFRDLSEERQDTIRSILDLGHIPAGMELSPATDTEQLSYIKKVIDECDYYVLIIGGRYGSLDVEGVSFTEREYDYAVETGKVVLAFVHGDAASIPVGKSDTAPRLVKALNEFREKVMTGRLVQVWTTRESLEAKVVKAVARAVHDIPALGWIRGDAAASADTLAQINALRIDNDKLKDEIEKLRASQKPKISDLAALDEEIVIPYKYTQYGSRGSYEISSEVKTNWAMIFKGISPHLISPIQRSIMEVHLSRFLRDDLNCHGTPSFKESVIALIANQFVASGHIKSYNANSVKGGVHAYLTLTEAGKALMVELLAVRSTKSSADLARTN